MFVVSVVVSIIGFLPVNDDEVARWRPYDHPAELKREFTAFTRPHRELSVSSEVQGKVVEVLVDEGGRIPSGADDSATVIRLDERLPKEELNVELAALNLAKEGQKASAVDVTRAKRTHEYRLRVLARIRALIEKDQASEAELDEAEYAADVSAIDLARAQSLHSTAEVSVLQGEARVARSRERLKRYTIRAPSRWRVEKRYAEPGHLAQPGQSLLRLVDTSRLSVPIRLSESELRVVRAAPRLELEVKQTGKRVSASLAFVSSEHDEQTQKRLIELEIASADLAAVAGEASGGIEVQLSIRVADASGGLRIPKRFVWFKHEQAFVRVSSGAAVSVTLLRSSAADYLVLLSAELPRDTVLIAP